MKPAASAQIRQVLELDESFWLAHLLHGVNQAVQRLWADALVSAEKAYALAPWNLRVIGLLAGMLTRTGTTGRAEELLQRLKPANRYGAPNGIMMFHLACSDIDMGAEWAEKAISQRDPVAVIHLLGPEAEVWRSSSRWPTLAGMMNVPEVGAN